MVTTVPAGSVPCRAVAWRSQSASTKAGLPPAPFGLFMGFVVPKEVPAERVEWLYALFKAAAESEVHQKRAGTIPGLTFDIIGPEAAQKVKEDIITFLDPVVRDLGLHIDG